MGNPFGFISFDEWFVVFFLIYFCGVLLDCDCWVGGTVAAADDDAAAVCCLCSLFDALL